MNLKEKLLNKTYNIEDLYIGLLMQVHEKSRKKETWLGGYDWYLKDVVTYKLLD